MSGEKINFGEQLQNFEHQPVLPTPEQAEPLRPGEKDPRQKLTEARKSVAQAETGTESDQPLKKLQALEKEGQEPRPSYVNSELKRITLRRELQNIRRRLPAPQRLLSQAIHQPAVRAVSEGIGKTVSRPSGLLGGGLVAFAGTSIYLYMARHYGFDYNYVIFLLLFAGGFVLGLLLELAVYAVTASRHKNLD